MTQQWKGDDGDERVHIDNPRAATLSLTRLHSIQPK
jgi:hypothetical protein